MQKAIIIGGSGYTGAELAKILTRHPNFELGGIYVSANSADANKPLSELYPELKNRIELALQPLPENVDELASSADVVFLATAHEVSHDLVPIFYRNRCKIFDLSGAYRVNDLDFYPRYYHFSHQHPKLLNETVYGLAEWNAKQIKEANLIAVPGCYPTVSQLSLKPLIEDKLLDLSQHPIINAVSGVSGAGRKASLATNFCQVSLSPYGIFNHRHQPEISAHLGCEVIFTPHLGNFKRGILATITAKLNHQISSDQVLDSFIRAYHHQPLIRLYQQQLPSIDAVSNSPYCDIGFAIKGNHIVIIGAEDNLLKGAASQAVQCANIRFGLTQTLGLI